MILVHLHKPESVKAKLITINSSNCDHGESKDAINDLVKRLDEFLYMTCVT